MKIVLIDHFDSFTYNLAQALGSLGDTVVTLRSSVRPAQVRREDPDALVLSPGPGHPANRSTLGVTQWLLHGPCEQIPTLGVCLGHQAVGARFGARIGRARSPVHGEVTEIHHRGEGLYAGIPGPFPAARYHSLVVQRLGWPAELEVTSWTADGTVMGLRHRTFPIEGVQFHPESYLTPRGRTILANFRERVHR